MSSRRIYLDNASTTPIDPRVMSEIDFHLKNTFGNAGSIHNEGVVAKKVLEESRKKVAQFLSAHPDEIVFTSGGTEANNLAILGTLTALKKDGLPYNKMRIIISAIEHSSIREVAEILKNKGVQIDEVPVLSNGIIDLVAFKKLLRPDTVLISIQYANNEIGTIQPLSEIAKAIRNFRKRQLSTFYFPLSTMKNRFPIFHTDASQAPCYLDSNVEKLGVDLLTLDGHKIYGPKGIGALYIRRGTSVSPISFGGGQERNLRPGTENIPLVAGLAKALEICSLEMKKETKKILILRDWLIKKILKQFPEMVSNGDRTNRLPNNINISIPDIDTEFLVLQLDAKGISVSTKSACMESDEGSYVVAALGGDSWRSTHTLRVTLGRFTKKSDAQMFLEKFSEIIKK